MQIKPGFVLLATLASVKTISGLPLDGAAQLTEREVIDIDSRRDSGAGVFDYQARELYDDLDVREIFDELDSREFRRRKSTTPKLGSNKPPPGAAKPPATAAKPPAEAPKPPAEAPKPPAEAPKPPAEAAKPPAESPGKKGLGLEVSPEFSIPVDLSQLMGQGQPPPPPPPSSSLPPPPPSGAPVPRGLGAREFERRRFPKFSELGHSKPNDEKPGSHQDFPFDAFQLFNPGQPASPPATTTAQLVARKFGRPGSAPKPTPKPERQPAPHPTTKPAPTGPAPEPVPHPPGATTEPPKGGLHFNAPSFGIEPVIPLPGIFPPAQPAPAPVPTESTSAVPAGP